MSLLEFSLALEKMFYRAKQMVLKIQYSTSAFQGGSLY